MRWSQGPAFLMLAFITRIPQSGASFWRWCGKHRICAARAFSEEIIITLSKCFWWQSRTYGLNSQLCLNDHGSWERNLSTEEKQMSLLSWQRQEGCRELHVCLTHLYPWEGDGVNKPGNNFQAHDGRKGSHQYSAWIHKEEIMLDQPENPLQQNDWPGKWEESSGYWLHELQEGFENLMKYRTDSWQ